MKEEWLFHGALVPIDAATTAALVAEIKRLIDVVGGMALAQDEKGLFIDLIAQHEGLAEELAQPEQEPVALVVSTAPDRIWLDLGFDPQDEYEIIFHELHDVTWSQDNASGNGIEYVRADTTPPKRPWVGLTDDDYEIRVSEEWKNGMSYAEAKLEELNI